jgi:hypothetical protein
LLKIDLTLFERERGGLFCRREESQIQRAYSEEEIIPLLSDFGKVSVFYDNFSAVKTPKAQRIHFAAVKGR